MGIAFAHAKIIGRKSGQSLSACAAYRHGKELQDEQYGKRHDYSGRRGVIAEGIALPVGAPEWMGDLQALTNAIERREERSNQRASAQLVREYVIALPHELDGEKSEWLVKNILKEGATREGMVAMWAIHEPSAQGDERNVHAHVMLSMRKIDASDPDGFGAKEREWNSRAAQERFKGVIERESNKMLERCGFEERISFEWGKGREGTIHMGHGAVALERKGIATEVGNANREIQARNAERGELDRDLAAVREQLERLVREPDAERSEVDSSPGVGEQRRSNERQEETAERLREERELAAAAIKAAWQGAERDPVSFVVALGEQGLTLAENEKGRFVAVDERGAVHGLSGAALGEKPWEVQRELQLAFKSEGSVQLPGVAEVREELREARDAERAESALGWAAHRRAEARERAAQWETNREIWKEQRQLDRQIDRVEAAQERPQSAVLQAIGRAYAESSNGAELVEELEWRGFMVCRVSAEEAERSRMQRAVLGTTPSYQEGEVLAVTERGQAYRINAETIAMTATNTYDHVQNVAERLAGIEPQAVLSLSQAQEVVTQNANERGSIPMDRFEAVPSAWEIGRGVEGGIDAAEGAAVKGLGAVTQAASAVVLGIEYLLGGASRKAPGGAEYEPPAAAGPPPPVVERPPWLEKQEKLRTTSGVEATQDPVVKEKVEEKQGQSFAEQWEELRRQREKAARERAALYREDEDRDRER